MLRIVPLLALAAAGALLAPAAFGHHPTRPEMDCDGDKQRPQGCLCPDFTWYLPDRTTGPLYVAMDEAFTGTLFSVWIYAESNGRPGLQRHDDYCTDDLAYMDRDADTIVF